MTRPPQGDPNDPRDEPPATRQFDPDYDPSAPPSQAYAQNDPHVSYGDPQPTAPYEGGYPDPRYPTSQYGEGQYGEGQYGEGQYGDPRYADPHYGGQYGGDSQYGDPRYTGAAPYAQGPYAGPAGGEPPQNSSSKRTIGLVLVTLAAVVILALVVVLIGRASGGDDSPTAAGDSSTTTATSAETTPSTTSTTTTTEETTSSPTTTQRSGTVTYQLTGNGDVVALTFSKGEGAPTVIAATGSPWSQRVKLSGTKASLRAIVVRGPVTCSILADGEQLSTATSNGGTLSCSADLSAE
ncbi:hypothetical protein [Gordonia aurantiaca]|uniref:hypothetical protein n=1 Tax=Gordonia sp. B21 TaxID=3151852 RepID=UPI0032633B41